MGEDEAVEAPATTAALPGLTEGPESEEAPDESDTSDSSGEEAAEATTETKLPADHPPRLADLDSAANVVIATSVSETDVKVESETASEALGPQNYAAQIEGSLTDHDVGDQGKRWKGLFTKQEAEHTALLEKFAELEAKLQSSCTDPALGSLEVDPTIPAMDLGNSEEFDSFTPNPNRTQTLQQQTKQMPSAEEKLLANGFVPAVATAASAMSPFAAAAREAVVESREVASAAPVAARLAAAGAAALGGLDMGGGVVGEGGHLEVDAHRPLREAPKEHRTLGALHHQWLSKSYQF